MPLPQSGHPESNQGPSDRCKSLQSDALPTELWPARLLDLHVNAYMVLKRKLYGAIRERSRRTTFRNDNILGKVHAINFPAGANPHRGHDIGHAYWHTPGQDGTGNLQRLRLTSSPLGRMCFSKFAKRHHEPSLINRDSSRSTARSAARSAA